MHSTHNQSINPPPSKSEKAAPLLNVWSLAGELGLLIAIPVVVFVLLGVWLDKRLGTLPLFIILGIILSMLTSIVTIARKIKNLNQ